MKPKTCHAMQSLPADALGLVANYFQALSEPMRLQVLNQLRGQARSVGELAQRCDSSAANVSRHLALLARQGLVRREARGSSVFYAIADESVYALCDLVCGCIAQRLEHAAAQRAAFRG